VYYIYSMHQMSRRVAALSDDGTAPSLLWMAIRQYWSLGQVKCAIERDPQLMKYFARVTKRLSVLMFLFYLLMFAGFIAAYIVKVHHWPWGY
jgi:hypothetical protein